MLLRNVCNNDKVKAMSEDEFLKINFGALAPPLVEQLEGILPKKDLKRYDELALAITRCSVHGLISDSAALAARKRLMKLMAKRQKELLQPKRKVPE